MTHISNQRQNQIRNSVEYAEGLKALSPRHEQAIPRNSQNGFWAVITNVCTDKDENDFPVPNYGKYSWTALKWESSGSLDWVRGIQGDFTESQGWAYVVSPTNLYHDTTVPIGSFVWMSRATHGNAYYCFQYPQPSPTFVGYFGGGAYLLSDDYRYLWIEWPQIGSPNMSQYWMLTQDLATGGSDIIFLRPGCYRMDISVYYWPVDAIVNANGVPTWTTSTDGGGSGHSHNYYPQKNYAAYVSCVTQGGSANAYALLPAYNNYGVGITTISSWLVWNAEVGDYIQSYGYVDIFDIQGIIIPAYLDFWFLTITYIGNQQHGVSP